MAVVNEDAHNARPTNHSIASLLGPSGEMPERNLLSLSRLAAEMEPVSPGDVFGSAGRTRSGPVGRRESRDSLRLGVASGSTKRMSRTKSAFGNMRRAVQAVASAATSSSESVLRPIQPASSKATSTTNSLDSCVGSTAGTAPSVAKTEATAAAMLTNLPRLHASRLRLENSHVFAAAAQRLAESQQLPRTPMTPTDVDQRMEIETGPNREPSTSSLDRVKSSTAAKARTTPDAKRAQNRESAKRFRVAQKKRWADLQDLVTQKDKEISRLTDMLQKVTDARQPVKPVAPTSATARNPRPDGPLDALVMAELDLFVKLVSSPGPASTGTTHTDVSRQRSPLLAAPASNIGSLHRVLVATTDGSITGVRHLNSRIGSVSGGAVGQYLWDEVHESDSLQLRFTVLHAGRFANEMTKEALVFAYRRGVVRRSTDGDSRESGTTINNKSNTNDQYIRMKGCVHPVLTRDGDVSHLMLAEFVET